MARTKEPKAPKTPKGPGRLKQMYQVFKMTTRYDKKAVWYMLAAFLLPVAASVVLALLIAPGSIIGLVLYLISGILGGLLAFLIVLGRRAERAAYGQIAGQPGAVGAVLKSSLRRGWVSSEMPVAVSPKTQDAVYRAVGRGGVVLIGEGPKSRTTRMLEDERRKVSRVLPNVPVHFLFVGPDADSVPLHKIPSSMGKYKRALNKAEIYAVNNRISSLGKNGLPIPKGVDPTKVRAGRPR
ncbi:DUF4191 domain-containing protein [Marisediminicola antarctica]|uniref:DUF4191 domain-containing protein n=1 Tax=Marisediminicola antarctica TaxID=674079 RepID=A0A7L5ALB2_9MICO|nr:DUF4191 domain-containing protein [Marisediminicola antarctica]QHO69921.1 hypothetical protein BHD05_09960 [Marisediminicola antarctica]